MVSIYKLLELLQTFPYKALMILVGAFFVPILIISVIYIVLISPLICNLLIVPEIEKKMGRKLGYSPLLQLAPFGKYLDRQIEISRYILNRYYAWKKYGEKSVPFGYERYALKHIGYTIVNISKYELIYSFSVRVFLYAGIFSFIIVFIAASLNSK